MVKWFTDYSNVFELASHLFNEEDYFPEVEDLLRYFEKPWKFQEEWTAYQKVIKKRQRIRR